MNNIRIDMPAVPHRVLFWSVNYWNRQYIDDPRKNQDILGNDLYGDGSLRLEVIRDGLEDFDYFTLADEWLGPGASAAYVNRIARSLKDFDDDPIKLEQVRRELGAALERTSRNALSGFRLGLRLVL